MPLSLRHRRQLRPLRIKHLPADSLARLPFSPNWSVSQAPLRICIKPKNGMETGCCSPDFRQRSAAARRRRRRGAAAAASPVACGPAGCPHNLCRLLRFHGAPARAARARPARIQLRILPGRCRSCVEVFLSFCGEVQSAWSCDGGGKWAPRHGSTPGMLLCIGWRPGFGR